MALAFNAVSPTQPNPHALENPLAGRTRSELVEGLRSFPVGNYVLFYRPAGGGIELIRALSGYRDIQAEDVV